MDNKPQIGLGEYLRCEREKRHITIEQVASATKINIKLLHALESDNFDSLPAKPFVRGFVTSYTRYVGLDHREILARFDLYLDEKSGQKFKRPEDAPHIFVEREGQVDNSKTVLSFVMVGFLIVALGIFVFIKPSLKHHRHREKTAVSNDDLVTVQPPPHDGAPIAPKAPALISAAPSQEQGTAHSEQAPQPTHVEKKPEQTPPVAELHNIPGLPPVLENSTKIAKKELDAEHAKNVKQAEVKQEPKPAPKIETKPESKAEPKSAATDGKQNPPSPQLAGVNAKIPPIPSNEVKHRLVVRAVEDAWVKYQVDDRPIQQFILKKDKVIFVRARSSLRFTSAKPKAIEISFDNKDFKAMNTTAKAIILPKDAEDQFKASPFVEPNPVYLSTPNH